MACSVLCSVYLQVDPPASHQVWHLLKRHLHLVKQGRAGRAQAGGVVEQLALLRVPPAPPRPSLLLPARAACPPFCLPPAAAPTL